jgi:hypothetical protein
MTPARRAVPRPSVHGNAADVAFLSWCRSLSARERAAFQHYVDVARKRRPNDVVVLADVNPREDPVAIAYDPVRPGRLPEHIVGSVRSLQKKTPGEEMRERFEAIRNRIMDEALSTAEVSRRLRISGEAIRKRLSRKELFGLKLGRDYRFPAWQFDPRSESGVVTGVYQVLEVTVLDPLELAYWFENPMEALEGLSPIDALRAGNLEDVIAAAEAAGVT